MKQAIIALLVSILTSTGLCTGDEPSPVTSEQKQISETSAPAHAVTSDSSAGLSLSIQAAKNVDPEPTPSVTEGPYFKQGSPERKSLLESGVVGERLNLTGRVLTRSGRPIAGSLLDFWQADGNGNYDLTGYRLRGHQYTDDQGRYQLETVIPGIYPGRTRHIHVKVQAPNGTALTTQLFFPGESGNQRDSIYKPELLVSMSDTAGVKQGTFDFVLDMD